MNAPKCMQPGITCVTAVAMQYMEMTRTIPASECDYPIIVSAIHNNRNTSHRGPEPRTIESAHTDRGHYPGVTIFCVISRFYNTDVV